LIARGVNVPRVKKKEPEKKALRKKSSTQTSAKVKPRRKTNPQKYTKKFLNDMAVMLKEMRGKLLEDVTKSIKEESDHLRFNVGDFYDHASEDRQRELALTLSNRERIKLAQIDDALKRIETGEYGFCEISGEKIGEERLIAMPFTKLSIEAQEEIERGDY